MDYTTQTRDGGVDVALSGQFTFADNQRFKQLMDALQEQSLRFIDLNFAGVDFIDSAGLGMLLLLRDNCQGKSIPVSLRKAHGQVAKIFSISKFDQLFAVRN